MTVQLAAAAELAVAAPPVAVAPSVRATTSALAADVKIACTQGALCTGPVTLSVARHAGAGFHHPAVATAHVTIRVGKTPLVNFTLTPFGKKLVPAHQGKSFDVTLLVRVADGNRFARRIALG